MGRLNVGLWSVAGISLFAASMGMFFARSAMAYPQASGVIPASLAFVAVALLGGVVAAVVGDHERRIRLLEQNLRGNRMDHNNTKNTG